MYVWRIPLANFAALLAFCGVVIVWEISALLRHHTSSNLKRGLLVGVAVVAALISPFLVAVVLERELTMLASRGVYVRIGPVIYVGPAVAAGLLFAVSRLAVRTGSPSAGLARAVFWVTAATVATLNLSNWCSPGWCERFGFPFPYSWWSDAIVIMNGVNLTAGTSTLAVVADTAILLGAAIVMPRALHRRAR